MTAGARLSSELRGDVVVVSVEGELDVFNAAEMTRLIESLVPTEAHGAVLDLSGLGFLDSTAIRKLFALTSRLIERRQKVHLVTPHGSTVLRTLQLVEFARAAPIHGSLEEALAQLDNGAGEPG
ncbi:MAG: anti-sigma factor antagonist [Solirubrobacteraceae bacterium]|jgi:anti-anti-sigma factor|nr:anti-sigma factor antagonist [Solirubrobacteraceae bacterium]MEA2187733.1 anti-sigma factor antagonist [Solirubrobacteraceae bacterium]